MCKLTCFAFAFFFIFSPFVFAQSYRGELEVLIIDDFDNNQSKTSYRLHGVGEVYVLELPSSVDKSKLVSGEKVIIKGQEIKGLKEKKLK